MSPDARACRYHAGIVSALPELAPGGERLASAALLEMYEGDCNYR
jgi:hypothetical protein